MTIQQNLTLVQSQISDAAKVAGRHPEDVRLIAVSKTKPMELIHEVFAAGQIDFGENRPQELKEKHPQLPEARWHMIGHLQRNKVKYLAPFVHLIHSVDSERLLAEINDQAGKCGRIINCLLQLNISEEDAKSGLDEVSTKELLTRIDEYPHVQIKGLMGMAAFIADDDLIRSQFRRLRLAREMLAEVRHPRIQMRELSMGMSGDFEIAIQEGATLVRIGSAIFGTRN